MTEYVIKEIGPHRWLVFADRQSIALCADENEALKVMTEHSTRAAAVDQPPSADNCPDQDPPAATRGGHFTKKEPAIGGGRQSRGESPNLSQFAGE
jgi:hypothetical protein